jgi:proteasome alpha subunit
MYTPYDWQEGIGHRAQFVEGRLTQGTPAIGLSLKEGVLVLTWRRQARKVFEVYDRLAFSAIGRQSDIEALRVAAVDFAHKEGYSRSEQDVTIQRVVAALSDPVKRAFGDFNSGPFVVRSLFAEVNASPEDDLFYVLEYDGDFRASKGHGLVAGTEEQAKTLEENVSGLALKKLSASDALAAAGGFWPPPGDESGEETTVEAVLIERSAARENRFRYLTGDPE